MYPGIKEVTYSVIKEVSADAQFGLQVKKKNEFYLHYYLHDIIIEIIFLNN